MNDLTLDEKLQNAERRARKQIAEKHFYDLAQPFFPLGFSVGYRDPGHWDVYAQCCPGQAAAYKASYDGPKETMSDEDHTTRERAFRIRGEPGNVLVIDERWDPHRPFPRGDHAFRSILAAMVWIMEELMQEPKS